MNSEQLFQTMAEIDDRFLQEAAEEIVPNRMGKMIGLAAAVSIVIFDSIWFSDRIVNGPDTPGTPVELAAPTAGVAPTAQPQTPTPDVPEAVLTVPPAESTPTPPEETDPLPAVGSGEDDPSLHEPPFRGEYIHNDDGDFIIFTCPIEALAISPEVLDITGQLVDGHFAATVPGLLAAQERYVELQVYADGSYDLYFDHDPFNDTEWWLDTVN